MRLGTFCLAGEFVRLGPEETLVVLGSNVKVEALALIVGGLAAFAALVNAGVALVGAWLDNRRLVIRLEPSHAVHAPVPRAEGAFRLIFVAMLSAFNPARTRNTLVKITACRDGQEVLCRWWPSGGPFTPTRIEPFEEITGEVVVEAFSDARDARGAYESVSRIRVEIKPARGRQRRFCFERAQFPLRE